MPQSEYSYISSNNLDVNQVQHVFRAFSNLTFRWNLGKTVFKFIKSKTSRS